MMYISADMSLPDDEIRFTFTRSGGPGGQNVNKVNTKVVLWFDIKGSKTLTDDQKKKIFQRLGNRINKEGMLQVVSMQFRNQAANRDEAVRRFSSLLQEALYEKPRRKKTRVPRRVKENRLQSKKRKSQLKASRARKTWNE